MKEVHDLLSYDQDTGLFTWKNSNRRAIKGKVAGHNHDARGYVRIQINGKSVLAHRLAWYYVYGVMPNGQIDHINGIKSDNRICNLRDVSASLNSQNIFHARSTNSHGYLGIERRSNGKWTARIRVNGKKITIGTYSDPDIAYSSYIDAKRKYHEGNTL